MKVLLVQPTRPPKAMGLSQQVPPLGLMGIASSLGSETTCQILDLRLESPGTFEEALRSFRPGIIGVTGLSAEASETKALARVAKKILLEASVVCGGYHATMATEDMLSEPSVDFAVLGEGEGTFPELVRTIANGGLYDKVAGIAFRRDGRIVYTPPRELMNDSYLDILPYPRWDLVERYLPCYHLGPMGGPVVGVETSRGCVGRCDFCAVPPFHHFKYRRKSPDRVVAELRRLPTASRVVAIVDDNFWADAPRAEEIASQIRSLRNRGLVNRDWRYFAQVATRDIVRCPELVEQWAGIGLRVLLVGIEFLSDKELAQHGKRTSVEVSVRALEIMREYGVEAWACFIIDPVKWTKDAFAALKAFILDHKIAFPQITFLTALHGTALSKRLLASGLRPSQVFPRVADFLHIPEGLRTKLPRERLFELLAELYRETGLHNREIFRRLRDSGVIDIRWLRSEVGRRVTAEFSRLCKPDEYVEAHRR